MRKIGQIHREFSQYYLEFEVIAANLDWNVPALWNALWMGLSNMINDSFLYSDMLEERPTFITMWQKWDNHIRQWQVEQAVQKTGGGTCFTTEHSSLHPSQNPADAHAGILARYNGPAPIDLCAGQSKISAAQRVKRFMYGGWLDCGEFDHRVADCAARKMAETLTVAEVEVCCDELVETIDWLSLSLRWHVTCIVAASPNSKPHDNVLYKDLV